MVIDVKTFSSNNSSIEMVVETTYIEVAYAVYAGCQCDFMHNIC